MIYTAIICELFAEYTAVPEINTINMGAKWQF